MALIFFFVFFFLPQSLPYYFFSIKNYITQNRILYFINIPTFCNINCDNFIEMCYCSNFYYTCAVNVLGQWCKTRIIFDIRMLINIHQKLCVLYSAQWVTSYIENITGASKLFFRSIVICMTESKKNIWIYQFQY